MSTSTDTMESTTLAGMVAENVRVECARQRVTQADLARALGISHTAVSARWSGRVEWRLHEIEQVAAALNASTTTLLMWPAHSEYPSMSRRYDAAGRAGGLPRLDSNQQPFD